MNTWAVDKIRKSMDLLVMSNNEQLTCGIITDEESQELSILYSRISKILCDATRRNVKEG
jgi:hypothetical protein